MGTIDPNAPPADPQAFRRLSELAQRLPVARRFVGVLGPRPADTIPLLGGNPALESLPASELSRAFAAALASPETSLQYSAPDGNAALIEWLAAREGVSPSRIIITNGALHALSLVVLATTSPGDEVVVDDPVFPVFLRVLQLADARPVPAPGGDGFDVDALEGLLVSGLRPRLVYTVPDYQNPSGTSLSGPARRKLVSLAEHYGFLVISDNPYRSTGWQPDLPDDVAVDNDVVIRVNTFSKSLGPGLRLGWLVVPEWLREPVVALRARTDQHPSTLTQAAVAQLVTEQGLYDHILGGIADEHRRRMDVLADELATRFGGQLRLNRPQGGFFLWPELTETGVSVEALHTAAVAAGTDFSRGSSFQVPGGADHAQRLRLGFSSVDRSQIPLAVSRLHQAYQEVARQP